MYKHMFYGLRILCGSPPDYAISARKRCVLLVSILAVSLLLEQKTLQQLHLPALPGAIYPFTVMSISLLTSLFVLLATATFQISYGKHTRALSYLPFTKGRRLLYFLLPHTAPLTIALILCMPVTLALSSNSSQPIIGGLALQMLGHTLCLGSLFLTPFLNIPLKLIQVGTLSFSTTWIGRQLLDNPVQHIYWLSLGTFVSVSICASINLPLQLRNWGKASDGRFYSNTLPGGMHWYTKQLLRNKAMVLSIVVCSVLCALLLWICQHYYVYPESIANIYILLIASCLIDIRGHYKRLRPVEIVALRGTLAQFLRHAVHGLVFACILAAPLLIAESSTAMLALKITLMGFAIGVSSSVVIGVEDKNITSQVFGIALAGGLLYVLTKYMPHTDILGAIVLLPLAYLFEYKRNNYGWSIS